MPDIPADELFLGESVDSATGDRTGEGVSLDPADFTTHGVIVGMTGSGKTGLGVVLLEETLRKGVPCLIIDPKGDMGNLALTFPNLAGPDFEPWVDPHEADREGVSVSQLAQQKADLWKNGLSGWGLGATQISELKSAADVTIYTPGSTNGVALNLIGSLAAPSDPNDVEAMQDEVEGFASSLLGLVGIDADPLSSPEHILLTNIIFHEWREGRSLDLATLLGLIQKPPMRKLGVMELDTFFPPKDRMGLAMKLNGLLASPAFASWAEGVPLDIAQMLWTPEGKPRAAVVSIGHLSDEERQFVVTLLLSKVVTWMRAQAGTGDLRALIYMDEVFGYAPPTAMPPSKKPILTILKQARAFGVGLVLATQNPVDIDYKAISNAGTWMIGRLQTERDKARLLDGMTSSSGEVDIKAIDDTISGLDKRQFVLHTTRGGAPSLFTTRWAMSYLAGPLSRDQINSLKPAETAATLPPPPSAAALAAAGVSSSGAPQATEPALADDETAQAPEVADGYRAHHLDPATPWADLLGATRGGQRLEPALVARVRLLFDDTKANLREIQEWEAVLPIDSDAADWTDCLEVDYDDRDLLSEPVDPAAVYAMPEAKIHTKTYFRNAESALKNHLYLSESLELLVNRDLKLYSRPGEARDDFEKRCWDLADDEKDAEASKLRDKIDAKRDRVQLSIAKHEDRIDELEAQKDSQRNRALLNVGASVLGSLLGGRKRTSSIARGIGRTATSGSNINQREQSIENRIREGELKIEELEEDLAQAIFDIDAEWSEKAANVEELPVALEKTDITVTDIGIVFVPKDRR